MAYRFQALLDIWTLPICLAGYLKRLGQKITIARGFLECTFLPALLLLFIASFFIAPNNKTLNKFDHFIVLPIAVLSLRWADYRWLYKLIPLRYLALLLAYFCLSLCWSSITPRGRPQEYIFQSLHLLYFIIIIIITAHYRDKWLAWRGPGLALMVTLHVIIVSWSWYSVHPFTVRMEGLGRLNNPLELAAILPARQWRNIRAAAPIQALDSVESVRQLLPALMLSPAGSRILASNM